MKSATKKRGKAWARAALRQRQRQEEKEKLTCPVEGCGLEFGDLRQLGTHKYWKHGIKKDGSVRDVSVGTSIPSSLIPFPIEDRQGAVTTMANNLKAGLDAVSYLRGSGTGNGHATKDGELPNGELQLRIEDMIQRLQTEKAVIERQKAMIESTLQNLNKLLEV